MTLKKYNQLLLAGLGSTAILTIVILLIFALIGGAVLLIGAIFSGNDNAEGLTVQANTEQIENNDITQVLDYGPIIQTIYSPYVIIPVGYRNSDSSRFKINIGSGSYMDYESQSSYSRYHSIYLKSSLSGADYFNLILYNAQQQTTRLVLKQKGLLRSLYYPQTPEDQEQKQKMTNVPKFLLFGISYNDTNNDGLLNTDDAQTGYLSDMEAKKIIQITPDQTHLNDWEFSEDYKKIYIRVILDTNGDKAFTKKDQTQILTVDLNAPGMGQPVTTKELEQQVKSLVQ